MIGWVSTGECAGSRAHVVVSDDGRSPENMIGTATAALWEQQGWAHRCPTRLLEPHHYDLRGASGQSLGIVYDVETELYPLGVDGQPSLTPHSNNRLPGGGLSGVRLHRSSSG